MTPYELEQAAMRGEMLLNCLSAAQLDAARNNSPPMPIPDMQRHIIEFLTVLLRHEADKEAELCLARHHLKDNEPEGGTPQ